MRKKIFFSLLIVLFSLLLNLAYASSNLQTPWRYHDKKAIFNEAIYVDEGTGNYYYYNVFSSKGEIWIEILNKDLTTTKLTFETKNKLVFRDAYENYIVVGEQSKKTSISYWVLSIVHTKKGFSLQKLPVNSHVDSLGFQFNDLYSLRQIIELDEKRRYLYAVLDSAADFNVYQIDLRQKYNNKMKMVNWFVYSTKKRQNIIGGNSHVLVEATNEQIWIDTRNKLLTFQTQTIYDKIDIKDVKGLKFYQGGSRVYNLASSYFQYVSVSNDGLSMGAFVYHGYDKEQVLALGSLQSYKKPIKFYSDDHNYFIAVSDNDAYFSFMYWDYKKHDYALESGTLKGIVKDPKKWPIYINFLRSALKIVFYDMKFFILTEDWLYVVDRDTLDKVKVEEQINEKTNHQQTIFKYMAKFYADRKSSHKRNHD